MGNPLRILVVEDSEDDEKLLLRELRKGGYDVRSERVDTAEAMQRALEGREWDVVVSDYNMPGFTGLDALRLARERGADTPFILVSGTAGEEVAVDTIKAGASDYLLKDRLARLVPAVEQALREDRDRRERRRAEEALRESEDRYRDLTENMNDLVQSVRPDGSFAYVNRAWRDTLRYSEEDVRRLSLWDVVHPDDEAHCRGLFDRVLAGENVHHIEVRFVTKDGKAVEVEGSANCRMADGKPLATRGIFHDMTLRRLAEKERRESEEQYRDLVEATDDLVQSVRPDGSIAFVNRAWCEALGYSEDEARGMSILDIIHPDSRQHCMEVFQRVVAGEKAENVEAEFVAKDGRKVIVEGSASCRFADGRPVATYGIFHDVTERRLAEKALRETEDQLRQSQKLEAIGRLAGGIAHDFNNMLGAIIGYSDVILLNLRKEDPVYRDVEQIKGAADRAAGLTRQLLAFSRKQVLEPRVINLNSIVTGIEPMLCRLIGEDIELSTSLARGLWRVKADPGQIEQVIMNLAVNSRDAMPTGGKLTMETANVDLDEEYASSHVAVTPGPHVMLAISDTGSGMDEATKARLFEPFFTTKEQGKGTGLGLSTAYGIVKQSGGNIWVYSEPGKGATFKVYLPRVAAQMEAIPVRKPEREPGRGTETVLVVEDEEVLRRLVSRILTLSGYKAIAAANGGEALIACEKHAGEIALVMTDVVMPGMGGRELADRMKTLCPTVRVLFTSGYTDNAIVHHGVLDPGTAFIQKPFTASGLAAKVREVLDAPGREARERGET